MITDPEKVVIYEVSINRTIKILISNGIFISENY